MDLVKFMNRIYEYETQIGSTENIFRGDLLTQDERDFLLNDSNAFLFGLISDQSVRAEMAWSLPYKLSKRLNSFSMEYISENYSIEDLTSAIKEKPALHRYPVQIGKYLWLAAQKVINEYEGIAENIWINGSAKEVLENLMSFKGISHKKASLACLLLVRDFGWKVSDKENIDIIYDIHIRRIFLRAGICEKDSLDDVVKAARKLNPQFPGYLTSSFWAIGREICRPNYPLCHECPIEEFCQKRIEREEYING